MQETNPKIESTPNRWLIAVAGTLLQMLLGTVYAWSYFQKPLVKIFGTDLHVIGAFSIAIFCLGLTAAWGGVNLPRFGPRKLAVIGGLLFGTGYLLAAAALHLHSLLLLYCGYGVIGGIGLGLGYVTPVATVAKWFPDKKGLVTGMVIMGFGLGALLMSKIIAPCFGDNYELLFLVTGPVFAVLAVAAACMLRNPPTAEKSQTSAETAPSLAGSLRSILGMRFFLLWMIFFCNILAGISIIGFQSPLLQELLHKVDPDLSASALGDSGATLIAISSLFNGVGRMFWGGVSDRIGRVWAFRIMLGTQVAAFLVLPAISNPWLFGSIICYVLLCYGGGFGTMPSFVLDVFGARLMAVAYGAILTAWSAGGALGPLVIAVLKRYYSGDPATAAALAFWASAAVLGVGFLLAILWRDEKKTA
jgi:OFA family oxalate/formate antiporter-like MFS transporter